MGEIAIEREIVERVQRLDTERQQWVLAFVRSLEHPQMTMAEWLEQAGALQAELKARRSDDFVFDVQSVLDEVREERLNDIMGGR
jgi:hypothetical protein